MRKQIGESFRFRYRLDLLVVESRGPDPPPVAQIDISIGRYVHQGLLRHLDWGCAPPSALVLWVGQVACPQVPAERFLSSIRVTCWQFRVYRNDWSIGNARSCLSKRGSCAA